MARKIIIDCPISYGANYYKTPIQHVEKNHFGEQVAGSRITAWESFSDMWSDIEGIVLQHIQESSVVQVVCLSFQEDIGLVGVARFEDVSLASLAIEERNGQPSLFCQSPNIRKTTKQLTVVVGPSNIPPNTIENYPGHSHPYVLYTIYPGEPSRPFPQCSEEQRVSFTQSLQEVISFFQKNDFQRAKARLFEAYSSLDGREEDAAYWSEHLLVRAF